MSRLPQDDEVFNTNDLNSYLNNGLKQQQEILNSKSYITPGNPENDENEDVRESLKGSIRSDRSQPSFKSSLRSFIASPTESNLQEKCLFKGLLIIFLLTDIVQQQQQHNNYDDDDSSSIMYQSSHGGDDDREEDFDIEGHNENDLVHSVSSFPESLIHINERLAAYGFPSPLVFKSKPDENDILNCIYLLLRQRQFDIEFRDDLVDRMSRLKSDNDNLAQNLKRVEKLHDQALRDVAVHRVKITSLNNDHKEELRKHQLTRQEKEYTKLKEQLGRHIQGKENSSQSNKGISQRKNIEIINGEFYATPSRMTTTLTHAIKNGRERNQDAAYQHIVGAFKDEKQELLEENKQLRQTVARFDAELDKLREKLQKVTNANASPTNKEKTGQHQLPYGLAKNNIEKNLEDKITEVNRLANTASEADLQSTRSSRDSDLDQTKQLLDSIRKSPSMSGSNRKEVFDEYFQSNARPLSNAEKRMSDRLLQMQEMSLNEEEEEEEEEEPSEYEQDDNQEGEPQEEDEMVE
ncbi:afadin- and alpha-actinin-binding protein [Acrasis kona]|uniref:Afadin- and alpha-actinin-binding protein n=1 Tax=Acrasis kona TaxID=1008807 RepID=A0AAW2ZQ43_9EUKA